MLKLKDGTFRIVQIKYRHDKDTVKDAGGAYAMLNRCKQHFENQGLYDKVQLIWTITNGTKAPHCDRDKDTRYIETPAQDWNAAFDSSAAITQMIHWIHRNILVNDDPPVTVRAPYLLRYVQESVMDDIKVMYRETESEQFRCIAVLPCATGTSSVRAMISRELNSHLALKHRQDLHCLPHCPRHIRRQSDGGVR